MAKISSKLLSSCLSNRNVLVCDNGSSSLKVGFSGDDCPRVIIPTVVGTARSKIAKPESQQHDKYIGRYAQANEDLLDTITRPISRGAITDWDAMDDLWNHMYYEELLVPPEQFPILHTEMVENSMSSREKHIEIMFESLNVPGTALIPDSALALYSYGKTTGLVLDSGYDHTRAVPVYEGYPMTHAMCNVPVGGRQVTERLGHVLKVRFCANIRTRRDWDAVKEIKKDCCYVAQDYDQEMAAYEDDTEGRKGFKKKSVLCKLPDGTTVDIGCEAFRCVEPLFRPGAFGVPSARHGGIGDAVRDAIDACRPGVRDVMYDNIVLAGGCAATPSLADRLGRELYRPHRPAVVDAPVGRKYATWLGGSVLASAVGVDQLLIDRGEYEEFGADVVRRKTVF